MVNGVIPPVLIVDDYPAMVQILHRILLDCGFAEVHHARDGSEALERVRDRPYGLIISDLNMKPISGLELLREVRRDAQLKSIPFIMVTATGESDQVIAAMESGVTDYVVKPFTAATLRKKLAGIFGDTQGRLQSRIT